MNLKIDFQRHYISMETRESLDQVANTFLEQFNKNKSPTFELNSEMANNVAAINFEASLQHPINIIEQKFKSSFSRSIQTYFVTGPIDYVSWINGDWKERVRLYQECLIAAISLLPKSRFSSSFKEELKTIFQEVGKEATKFEPLELAKIRPIYLMRDENGKCIAFGFEPLNNVFGWEAETIEPSEAYKWCGKSPFEYDNTKFAKKYYKKNIGIIQYREIWYDGKAVTKHFGVCGQTGETEVEEIADSQELLRASQEFERKALGDGFKEIGDNKLHYLVIEYD
ncbi:MAG: hypothetical protein FD128_2719, partial [Hyphomonadaceae bacterium]